MPGPDMAGLLMYLQTWYATRGTLRRKENQHPDSRKTTGRLK